ncbi:MAG: helix-turn-helix domain-containing protein [Chitinivibrionales bacterium]|nr:helix-turn-helix domain-containing protein [Chitinivibrionales bacterium]
MHYYARISKAEGYHIVSFPDFPNINTYGETHAEALRSASEALNACLETDFERGYTLPAPSAHRGRSFHPVEVLPHIALAYQMRQLRNGKSQVELARELGISYQAYQKLENPRRCNPTVKTLERISAVLGRKLRITLG